MSTITTTSSWTPMTVPDSEQTTSGTGRTQMVEQNNRTELESMNVIGEETEDQEVQLINGTEEEEVEEEECKLSDLLAELGED